MTRLDGLLSGLCVVSRADAARMVRAGRVTVDHVVVKDGALRLTPGREVVTLDGCALDTRTTRHVMLHKPAGLLTAARDQKQPTVMDILPPVYGSLGCMPAGRLDKDVTGLLLLTTDGELAHRLLSPKRHVNKTYEARTEGMLTQAHAAMFLEGLTLPDMVCQSAVLDILEASASGSLCRLTVREGKFHQVKRMLEAVSCPVLTLRRLTFGPLALDECLSEGMYRELTADEASSLYREAGMPDGEAIL